MYKRQAVYIFDEAASNIDVESEELIMDVIHHQFFTLCLLYTSIEKQDKSQEYARDSQHSREPNAYFIEKILEKGKFQVGIAVHQMSRNSETRISMAHQGFEHLALCLLYTSRCV